MLALLELLTGLLKDELPALATQLTDPMMISWLLRLTEEASVQNGIMAFRVIQNLLESAQCEDG